MRRNVAQEEESLVPSSVSPVTEEQEPQVASTPETAKKAKGSGGGGKVLRGGIVLFGGLGLFAFLVPTITGVPLGEWLQGANFKAAYSGENLSYMSGSAALKIGNLAGATDTLLKLPPQSAEADELAVNLFPRLVTAGDYTRAVIVCKHVLPESVLKYTAAPPSQSAMTPGMLGIVKETKISTTVNLREISRQLIGTLGLEQALVRVAQDPEMNALHDLMIPSLFSVIAAQGSTEPAQRAVAKDVTGKAAPPVAETIAMLEKLVPTLKGQSQIEAIKTIVQIHSNLNQLEPAWKWSLKLPGDDRFLQLHILLQEIIDSSTKAASTDPRLVLRLLQDLGAGEQADNVRSRGMWIIANRLPTEIPHLLASIKTPLHHDMAIRGIILARPAKTKEGLPLLDQMVTPAAKAATLTPLATWAALPIAIQELVPRFTAIARKNRELIKAHDDLLRYLIVKSNDHAAEEHLLNQMLDPATKSAARSEWAAGKLTDATLPWERTTITIRKKTSTQ
ncbi:MAG: hypothetical protein QM758_07350 [Armatimonas sp.]